MVLKVNMPQKVAHQMSFKCFTGAVATQNIVIGVGFVDTEGGVPSK